MTDSDRRFSDEELTAFLDGEASPALAGEIEAALARDASLRARLSELEVPVDVLRAATDPTALGAPAMPALPPVARRQTASGLGRLAAGLAAGLLLGVLGTYGAFQLRAPDWIDVVASYQSLYVRETVAVAEQSAAAADATFAAFEAELGLDLGATREVEDLDFRRVQRLAFRGEPIVQIAYLSEAGTPFALCITRVSSQDRDVTTETLEGMAASHWTSERVGFLLIGGTDKDLTDRVARQLQAAL